eukprot:165682_1
MDDLIRFIRTHHISERKRLIQGYEQSLSLEYIQNHFVHWNDVQNDLVWQQSIELHLMKRKRYTTTDGTIAAGQSSRYCKDKEREKQYYQHKRDLGAGNKAQIGPKNNLQRYAKKGMDGCGVCAAQQEKRKG